MTLQVEIEGRWPWQRHGSDFQNQLKLGNPTVARSAEAGHDGEES